jgi:hypothetical protein
MRSTRPSPRITFNRVDTRSQHREPDPRRKPAYGPWIRSLGICAGCGRQGVPLDAHHESAVEDKSTLAMAVKVNDLLQAPLCSGDCHEKRHRGQLSFWGDTDIPRALVRALNAAWKSDDVDAAARACFRASQDRVNKLADARRMAG